MLAQSSLSFSVCFRNFLLDFPMQRLSLLLMKCLMNPKAGDTFSQFSHGFIFKELHIWCVCVCEYIDTSTRRALICFVTVELSSTLHSRSIGIRDPNARFTLVICATFRVYVHSTAPKQNSLRRYNNRIPPSEPRTRIFVSPTRTTFSSHKNVTTHSQESTPTRIAAALNQRVVVAVLT